jgi:hypothetical protein
MHSKVCILDLTLCNKIHLCGIPDEPRQEHSHDSTRSQDHPNVPLTVPLWISLPTGIGLRLSAPEKHDSSHWTLLVQSWHAYLCLHSIRSNQQSNKYITRSRFRFASATPRCLDYRASISTGSTVHHCILLRCHVCHCLEALRRVCLDNL